MKALVYHGKRDVRVEDVTDPIIQSPTDIIIKVTTSGLCGSDLHLYEVLGPYLEPGDILGHEPMGIVEEVGADVRNLRPGDRVVIPFNISCGGCFMCERGLQSQCETTQVTEYGSGAALFGYTKLYGQVAGAQAEYLRVPQGHYGPIKVPSGPSDDRFIYLSDVLPTAWQGVEYANIPEGGSLVVFGLGPIGQMAARIAHHRGHRVIGVDLVQDRLDLAESFGIETVKLDTTDDIAEVIRERTAGRGTDAAIDAVGMEAHGAPAAKFAQDATSLLPKKLGRKLMETVGVDRLSALYAAIESVRRGGTVSVSGVYGGMIDPLPMMTMFDKQLSIRMGQANVKRWIPEIMPLISGEDDPLGVEDFASHHLPLAEAPAAYKMFQAKKNGAFKILLHPH